MASLNQVDLFPEIIEQIIQNAWNSDLSPNQRIAFMTTCPQLNRTWRSQYARIASISIHIPRMKYLLYLAEIVRSGHSLVYNREYLRTCARTIVCFLDLRERTVLFYSYTVWGVFMETREIHDQGLNQYLWIAGTTKHSEGSTPCEPAGFWNRVATAFWSYIKCISGSMDIKDAPILQCRDPFNCSCVVQIALHGKHRSWPFIAQSLREPRAEKFLQYNQLAPNQDNQINRVEFLMVEE
ncbi:hypothetical protein BT96DRAFT_1053300 [Gymnopus androsaceus JB14]|uniref:Uncharacterized protein n=1 Tax=Gymnopus androsaceus JB14 TaxID=1447944 RepID=A0A6A4IQR4_9AGAR|nr:hypothetical protein BT96DRAFT_1053300 [Gymnopus androsaceus JB14]